MENSVKFGYGVSLGLGLVQGTEYLVEFLLKDPSVVTCLLLERSDSGVRRRKGTAQIRPTVSTLMSKK